jgi:hypothetical protein
MSPATGAARRERSSSNSRPGTLPGPDAHRASRATSGGSRLARTTSTSDAASGNSRHRLTAAACGRIARIAPVIIAFIGPTDLASDQAPTLFRRHHVWIYQGCNRRLNGPPEAMRSLRRAWSQPASSWQARRARAVRDRRSSCPAQVRLESRLRRDACDRKMTLVAAPRKIAKRWVATAHELFG